MKFMFIDTETTGTNPEKNGIIQIAGIITSDDLVEYESFNYHVQPFDGDEIVDQALEVSGNTKEMIAQFPYPREIHKNLTALLGKYVDKFQKLDKFFFIGYNAKFDMDFMRTWFAKNGDKFFGSWFWPVPIDVLGLAAFLTMDKRPFIPNMKLGTMAELFKIEADGDLHDALTDIRVTIKLFKILDSCIKDRSTLWQN